MSDADRERWDARHATSAQARPALPHVFERFERLFPTRGHALEIACGLGSAALWLARRGLDVDAVDVSPVAIARAQAFQARQPVAARVRFAVYDLDQGLPHGAPVDVLLCCNFRAPHLYPAMARRLAPGGLLAVTTLSRVGAIGGAYRAEPGELHAAFRHLATLAEGERDGRAWLLARRREE